MFIPKSMVNTPIIQQLTVTPTNESEINCFIEMDKQNGWTGNT
jgi:hypothetical protein